MKCTLDHTALNFNLERVKSLETSLCKQLRNIVDVSSSTNVETQSKARGLYDAYFLLTKSTSTAVESTRITVTTLREVFVGISRTSVEGRAALTSELGILQQLIDVCNSEAESLITACTTFSNEVTTVGEMLNEDIKNMINNNKQQLAEGESIRGYNQDQLQDLQFQLEEAEDLWWQIGKLRMDVIALEFVELSQEWYTFRQINKQIAVMISTTMSLLDVTHACDSESSGHEITLIRNWLQDCSLVLGPL